MKSGGGPGPARMGTRKNSIKAQVNKHEKELAEKLGGKRQPASGALMNMKGDIVTDTFLFDSKETEASMINISHKDLTKITREAYESGKIPALIITLKNLPLTTENEWCIVPLPIFAEMLSRGMDKEN